MSLTVWSLDATAAEGRDCECGHCWYDHFWRERGRTNCRIIGCACESYRERYVYSDG